MSSTKPRPRSMAQWAQAVRDAGITSYDEACKWLRTEQGLSSNYAMMAASVATMEGGFRDYGDEEQMLAAMYSGPKEHLRPIFEQLHEEAFKLGEDVELVVCKTYTSFRRNYQFAIVAPSNRTTVDLGLSLPPETEATGRLGRYPSRDPNDRVQWRVRLQSGKDIDAEVRKLLKAAYKYSAKKRGQ